MDEKHTFLALNECISQIPLYLEGLGARKYSFPAPALFQERIRKILRIDINHISQCANVTEHPLFLLFTSPDYGNILFAKKENIIFPLSTTGVTDTVIERALHWNKFIIYTDNHSLTWLIENDIPFLTQLIISFGYDTNYKLNKAVLRDIANKYFVSKKPIEFTLADLFATRNRGKLEIRKGLIQFVAGNSTSRDNQLLILLYDYGCYVLQTKTKFSEEEKLQVATYIAYYIELCYSKYEETGLTSSNPPGSFLKKELLPYPGAIEKLEENNFYTLSGLAELVEKCKKKTTNKRINKSGIYL